MKNRIVVYADKESRASPTALKEEFARALGTGTRIVEVTAADVREGRALDEHALAFVLPGIIGEDSLYHAHIGEKGNEVIRSYVERGGAFMGLCAGAYYAAQAIEYVPEWGAAKGRTEGLLALFGGVARGPVPGLGTDSAAPGAYNGCATAPVQLEDGARGEIAYSSGPAFYNLPPGAEVLAHYDTAGKPVAAFTMKAGKGRVILSGVLPQYGVWDGWTKPAKPYPLDRLFEKLKPHEPVRRALWGRMAGVCLG